MAVLTLKVTKWFANFSQETRVVIYFSIKKKFQIAEIFDWIGEIFLEGIQRDENL